MSNNTNLLGMYSKLAEKRQELPELDFLRIANTLSNESFIRIKNENEVHSKEKEALIAELKIFQDFIVQCGLTADFTEFYKMNNQESLQKQANASQSLINMISYLLERGESLEP